MEVDIEADNGLQSSDSAVSMTPRDQNPRCHLHCGIGSHGFNDTAGLDTAVSMTPRISL
jgi:hypothetical protein